MKQSTLRVPLERLFVRRVVDQVCPSCDLREAGGAFCTSCHTPTSLEHYIAARIVELDGQVLARRNDRLAPIVAA
jgi:methionyl-tRNA synthetase